LTEASPRRAAEEAKTEMMRKRSNEAGEQRSCSSPLSTRLETRGRERSGLVVKRRKKRMTSSRCVSVERRVGVEAL
jgi:hypothetical protein